MWEDIDGTIVDVTAMLNGVISGARSFDDSGVVVLSPGTRTMADNDLLDDRTRRLCN